jgi:hypothetical protein
MEWRRRQRSKCCRHWKDDMAVFLLIMIAAVMDRRRAMWPDILSSRIPSMGDCAARPQIGMR